MCWTVVFIRDSGLSRPWAGRRKNEDLKTFLSTSVLVTARDIIFLWVSRMVMMGMKFMGQRPFDDVFVTGTILDKDGQRMSKTKMNGVDPLDVFDKYGVDATRIMLASVGSTDIRWNEKQVESIATLLQEWNAGTFCVNLREQRLIQRVFEEAVKSWPCTIVGYCLA